MNSFLAAQKGSVVVTAWLDFMVRYWSKPNSQWDMGYWASHHGFGQLVNDGHNDTATEAWQRTPRISADWEGCGPHFFVPQHEKLLRPCSRRLRTAIRLDRTTPVWKLALSCSAALAASTTQVCIQTLLDETRQQALEWQKNSFPEADKSPHRLDSCRAVWRGSLLDASGLSPASSSNSSESAFTDVGASDAGTAPSG